MRKLALTVLVVCVLPAVARSGAMFLAARAVTGFWCPRCEVERMTAELHETNVRAEALIRSLAPQSESVQPAEAE